MSTLIRRDGGYHDIDVELDSGTIAHLPHGLMQHHAFQPQMWRVGDLVVVTTTDGERYEGRAVDVSMDTGNMLVRLDTGHTNPGESIDTLAS